MSLIKSFKFLFLLESRSKRVVRLHVDNMAIRRYSKWTMLVTTLLCAVTLLFSFHAALVFFQRIALQQYTNAIFSRVLYVDFQLKRSLHLAQRSTFTPCSYRDIAYLRHILDEYHYLGDLGRVSQNKVICTVKKGLLVYPLKLKGGTPFRHDKIQHWNSQLSLFDQKESIPILTLGRAMVSVSSGFLLDIELFSHRHAGFGGFLHTPNHQFIYRSFGAISEPDIRHMIQYQFSWRDWLPDPNRKMVLQQCIVGAEICLTTINHNLGIYGLSQYHSSIVLITLGLLVLICGYILAKMIEHWQLGPSAFFRKLRHAIRKHKIYPVYQPKVSLENQSIVGVEALARWDDPQLGTVSPNIFVAVAEDEGLIHDMTCTFIQDVFAQCHLFLEFNPCFTVSINITPEILVNHTFLGFLNHAMAQYRFRRQQVILEITERSMTNSGAMALYSQKLMKAGYQISLDDFGTGFSNLSWLAQFDPNEIKIDKMFTQAIDTQTVNSLALSGMFNMLESLDVSVVFEGIETEQQLEFIQRRVPNAIGQGWLFSKPLSLEAFRDRYLKGNKISLNE